MGGAVEQIIVTLAASILGGGITGMATLVAIRTDVGWLKIVVSELRAELRAEIRRAHERIDALDRTL